MTDKRNRLFLFLGAFFIANALLAEFIGVKVFSLERTLGAEPLQISLFGVTNLSFNLTAGVLLWPIVFVMSDIINEYYGRRGVRLLSFMAAGLIVYAFVMVSAAIAVHPADFWVLRDTPTGPVNMEHSFRAIFGQGLWIIVGSLVAFLIGQLLDVFVFYQLKRITGDRAIWIRATGSTLVSQLVDSFVVLFIAFYIGAGWSLAQVFAIGLVNYAYKFTMAFALTPVLYWVHAAIDRYLGLELSHAMIAEATAASDPKAR
jgi:queuosine precursor transporter